MKKQFPLVVIFFVITTFSVFAQTSITLEPTNHNQLKLIGNGNGANWPSLTFLRSSGTSQAPAAVLADMWLLSIEGQGYTGNGYSNSVLGANTAMQVVAAENFTPTANGTYIRFSTTPLGTATPAVERMRINPAGNVGIGTTTPRAPLQFANSIANRKIVLYDDADNDHQFNGLGIGNAIFRYQVATTGGNHVFYAGSSASASNELMRIKGNGNVGIGTAAPNAPLQFGNVTGNRKIVIWEDFNNDHQFNGFGINDAIMRYQVAHTNANHVFYAAANGSASNELMRIKGNGNVGIGTSTPDNKLDVLGTIRANEVIIESGWADYVFDEGFKLKSLNEVESFIKENKHLPDVPSAKEVQEKGAHVSDLMTKMMQKIEELTLYSIAQQKRIEALEKRLNEK
ncbi:hypothetical protein [Emticicia agri]|uniref:Peptidase S74 domain-containing protein n=1 Tax=Emticicia agri TaxID=2492393 RepID=A0A4Q5LXB4_9BACT|nr:hypothetical protein [Emticicia agri]RYU94408.1 hypothetical protein EWM59_17340 [Emticicia agri]